MIEISVVIPAYNCEATIQHTLQSVFQQTFQDFEIIVVDDCSKDATVEVVQKIADSRVKIHRHSENQGASAARNTAIKSASGKYLAFLDSDDEWQADKLTRQVETIRNSVDDLVANVCGYYILDEFDIRRTEIPPHPESWYRHLLMGCGLATGSTLLVSRDAFEQVGYFDTSLPRYEDWDWMLRFTKQFPLTITNAALATIFRPTRPAAQVVETSMRYFLEKHREEFDGSGYYGKRAIGKRYLEVSLHYFLEGKKAEGRKWFRKTLVESPIQRPGMYLRILDAILGTSMVPGMLRLTHPSNNNQ